MPSLFLTPLNPGTGPSGPLTGGTLFARANPQKAVEHVGSGPAGHLSALPTDGAQFALSKFRDSARSKHVCAWVGGGIKKGGG